MLNTLIPLNCHWLCICNFVEFLWKF